MMAFGVLVSLLSMAFGYVVAMKLHGMDADSISLVIDNMGRVIYELENRLMRKSGIPLDDIGSRIELRNSVSRKVSSVKEGCTSPDEEWKDD